VVDTHDLTLVTTSDGLSLYAFTFLGCVVAELDKEIGR